MSRWHNLYLALCILLGLTMAGCAPRAAVPPAGLAIEEHALAGPPSLDPLTFSPLEGDQVSVLSRHADARAQRFPVRVEFVGSDPEITSIGENAEWRARLSTSTQAPPQQVVTVERDGREVFSTPAGMPSPILPLQGLWSYSGHWALELVDTDSDEWRGQVFIDGKLINEAASYDEAFSFQLLDGRPFFLFSRAGRLGYTYDGAEVDLGYVRIPHYRCCSESVLNPVQAQSMVAFFAQRGEGWFYVELGNLDD